MIRLGKPVQLYEWGIGTNTLNQIWTLCGKGTLLSGPKIRMGASEIAVQIDGRFEKKNPKDDSIKIMQQGEGMTPTSDKWGEVAMGRLKSVSTTGQSVVTIEVKSAIKIGKGTNVRPGKPVSP